MDSIKHDAHAAGATNTSQRSRARDSMFLIASIRLDGDAEPHDVRIRNLSEGGLMAELGRVVETGTGVAINLRGIGGVSGKVAWCTEGRVGIVLDTAIDPKRARKPVGDGRHTPVYAKPTIAPRLR